MMRIALAAFFVLAFSCGAVHAQLSKECARELTTVPAKSCRLTYSGGEYRIVEGQQLMAAGIHGLRTMISVYQALKDAGHCKVASADSALPCTLETSSLGRVYIKRNNQNFMIGEEAEMPARELLAKLRQLGICK